MRLFVASLLYRIVDEFHSMDGSRMIVLSFVKGRLLAFSLSLDAKLHLSSNVAHGGEGDFVQHVRVDLGIGMRLTRGV